MSKRVFSESPESRTQHVAFARWAGQAARPAPECLAVFQNDAVRLRPGGAGDLRHGRALLILDVSATVYQYVCFFVYGIPRVRRSDYLVIDRHRLPYLNAFEKLHCVYCSYANQLIEYAREINSRSEQFFCPIKHARRTLDPHHRTERFFGYGDARGLFQNLETMRNDWDK